MTTAATLAGLVPLALGLGAGSELQRPLAVATIGGLLLSTLVTLVRAARPGVLRDAHGPRVEADFEPELTLSGRANR